jgi:hypothetical protein
MTMPRRQFGEKPKGSQKEAKRTSIIVIIVDDRPRGP